MKFNDKKRKPLWLCGIILAVIYYFSSWGVISAFKLLYMPFVYFILCNIFFNGTKKTMIVASLFFYILNYGLQLALAMLMLMKEIPELSKELQEANEKNVFGTKMRSVIYEPNREGIKDIVKQQFEFAKIICDAGLVPIIEPEVDIHSEQKEMCEVILKEEIKNELESWNKDDKIMFKFTIPTVPNYYLDLYDYECVVRIVALSGGYSIDDAVKYLSENNRMIASFSRALLQDLNAHQSQEEFDSKLNDAIVKIYDASIS